MLIYAWITMNDSGSIFLTQGALPESNIKIYVYVVFNDSGSQKSYMLLGLRVVVALSRALEL